MNAPLPQDVLAEEVRDALSLLHEGRTDEAEAAAKGILNQSPDNLAALDILGLVQQKRQDYAQAETLYQKALKMHKEAGIVHFRLGECAHKSGRREDALTYYQKACELTPGNAPMLTVLGKCLLELKRPQEAENVLLKAIEAAPGFLPARMNLAGAYHDLGRFKKAIEQTEAALEINPDLPAAHSNLGSYEEKNQNFETAALHYKKALNLAPNLGIVRANLVSVLEKMNRLDEASDVLDASPEEDSSLLLARARILRRQKKEKQALALLQAWDDTKAVQAHEIVMKYYEMGKLCDGLKNYQDAFLYIEKANNLWLEAPDVQNRDKEEIFKDIEAYQKLFTEDRIGTWSAPVPYIGRPPVMLVGFPRSGTTLLDRLLHAHPQACVMEERPVADTMAETLKNLPDIARIDTLQLAQLQSEYFARAARYMDLEAGKTLIDKMPLNMILLGPMNRIFLDLKAIVVLRHPCDCILSALMQHFLPNKGMLPLAGLESAVRLYTKSFDLLFQYEENLPGLRIHHVRYEDLVEDTEDEARKMLEFIGLQ